MQPCPQDFLGFLYLDGPNKYKQPNKSWVRGWKILHIFFKAFLDAIKLDIIEVWYNRNKMKAIFLHMSASQLFCKSHVRLFDQICSKFSVDILFNYCIFHLATSRKLHYHFSTVSVNFETVLLHLPYTH